MTETKPTCIACGCVIAVDDSRPRLCASCGEKTGLPRPSEPESIPIGPEYGTELLVASSDGTYR